MLGFFTWSINICLINPQKKTLEGADDVQQNRTWNSGDRIEFYIESSDARNVCPNIGVHRMFRLRSIFEQIAALSLN